MTIHFWEQDKNKQQSGMDVSWKNRDVLFAVLEVKPYQWSDL